MGSEEGFVLIVGLMFLVILTLVGTTAYVMTSTDIKVGGNFKNYQRVLKVADAGAERGREEVRLLNASSTNKKSFDDELSGRVGTNAVLEGYGGDDPALFTGTLDGITYEAYLTNNAADTGISNQDDTDNRVLITAVATGPAGAFARVEKEAAIVEGPNVMSPSYSKGDVTGNGASMSISGIDACGQDSTHLPEMYTYTGANIDMNPEPGGITTVEGGSENVDIEYQVNSIKPGATVIIDPDTTNFGDSNNYVTLYSQPDPSPPTNGDLTLDNISGYGTLLVDGDLTITGSFDWHGLVLVTGTLALSGGGNATKSISGAVYTNDTITYNGNIDIQYDSCAIANAMTGWPLQPLSWKQVL